MMVNYEGKHVVITGASGGMGRLLCRALASEGAKLSMCSNDEAVTDLAKELSCDAFAKTVDVTSEAQVKAFFAEAFSKHGEIYALANLAGLSIPSQIPEMEEGAFDLMMDVNVKGTFLCCKHFAQSAADPAIIVNIGSMAARNANGNAPIYCTAKAAVNMLSKGLRMQVGSKNIRVTTVNPGGADTPFWGTRAVDRTKLMGAEDVVEIILFVLKSNPSVQIHDIFFESALKF